MKWYPPQRTHPIRLEPKPWTGRERRKRLPEWTGTVVATSKYGIKVVEDGGWLNWSLPDYRGTPFDEVDKGDKVRFEYAEVEKDGQKKTYISVIENLSNPSDVADSPFPPDEVPGGREPMLTSGAGFGTVDKITRSVEADRPLPSAADFPPDEPQERLEPTEDYGQSLWAKDRLRARTDCIACAVGIFKSSIELGLITEFPKPETVVAYAATLELWAKSE